MECKRESVSREVISYTDGGFHTRQRELVDETGWQIRVNDRGVGEISCSPWELRAAAVGYLYTGGYIKSAAEVQEVAITEETGIIAVKTEEVPAEPGTSAEAVTITAAEVMTLASKLEDNSHLFHRTGGVHCAALARGGEFLVRQEDVSRHAAVDKVAGAALERGVSMSGGILVFSGRVPGEVIRKAAVMGCCMVIARSAPTEYACRLAEKVGITLVGFAREEGFNIYTCPERVKP